MRIKLHGRNILLTACVLALCTAASATLSKSDRTKKKKNDKAELNLNIFERGLVTEDLKKKQITEEHNKFSPLELDTKKFPGAVLGYVTPWNSHGYDVAKKFGAKFTHISPVWLQIKKKSRGKFVIEGGHDIDKGWMTEVRRGDAVSIVPRVLFDDWKYADFHDMLSNEDLVEDCVGVLIKFLNEKKFQGAVLEIWSQLSGKLKKELVHFLGHFADEMHKAKKTVILAIPPAIQANRQPGMFVAKDFEKLVDKIDYFSLMTYDYSTGGKPGPNSPLPWVRLCVETLTPNGNAQHRSKILLGLNFYGTNYIINTVVEPILGTQFVQVLNKHKPQISWDSEFAEHFFEFKSSLGQQVIYYPTLYSIYQRLELARNLGTGISIWELGQGLDYFYELF